MTPIKFKEYNQLIAEHQPDYITLPAHMTRDEKGMITCCWKLTLKERLLLLCTGKLWHSVLTFNRPLQPIRLSTTKPLMLDQDEDRR